MQLCLSELTRGVRRVFFPLVLEWVPSISSTESFGRVTFRLLRLVNLDKPNHIRCMLFTKGIVKVSIPVCAVWNSAGEWDSDLPICSSSCCCCCCCCLTSSQRAKRLSTVSAAKTCGGIASRATFWWETLCCVEHICYKDSPMESHILDWTIIPRFSDATSHFYLAVIPADSAQWWNVCATRTETWI